VRFFLSFEKRGILIGFDNENRPDTHTILQHPYFWDSHKRLTFLQDVSDRFEIMCRDPKDPRLLTLETEAMEVVGNDWHSRLDKVFVENLGKYRKYDGKSVQDLLRALRNKVRPPPVFFLFSTAPALTKNAAHYRNTITKTSLIM